MTRPLATVPADGDVDGALCSALDGSGPALRVLPVGVALTADQDTLTAGVLVDPRIAVVVETSGSSGRPKRVALSARALRASAAATDVALGGAGQWLLCLPAHYVAGLQVLVRSIAAGTSPVILEPGHFDPRAFVDAARGLTADRRYVSLVPVQLARLVEYAETDPSSADILRRFDGILVGGQATPASLVERARMLGATIRLTYGASETAGGCVYDGVPLGRTRLRLVDGLVQIGGETLAEGYLDEGYALDVRMTDAAFAVDPAGGGEVSGRWYRTGDLGVLTDADPDDPEGRARLTVLGRSDDVIVSGGEKVSLGAVERTVQAIGLLDAIVVGRADERWGEVPVVVVGRGPAVPELGKLRRLVADALGRAAAPAAVVELDELPRLASGKPDRVAARAAVSADRDR